MKDVIKPSEGIFLACTIGVIVFAVIGIVFWAISNSEAHEVFEPTPKEWHSPYRPETDHDR